MTNGVKCITCQLTGTSVSEPNDKMYHALTQNHSHSVLVMSCSNSAGINLTAFSDPPSGTVIQPGSVPPVLLNQSVDLLCMASGDPPITYTWVLRGQENIQLNSDPTNGNFTTQVNQYGVYICITTNNLGTDAASIDIIQASKSNSVSVEIVLQ